MTYPDSHLAQDLSIIVEKAVRDLTPQASSALAAHPAAILSALAVAASALDSPAPVSAEVERIGGTSSARVAGPAALARLDARTRPGTDAGHLLGSSAVAERVGLKTRQSVLDWLAQGRLIGWQGAKRGYLFPNGQFDERGQPLHGIAPVVRHFDDGYAAWHWLNEPLAALDGDAPLARLHAGDADGVVAALESDAQGDFA